MKIYSEYLHNYYKNMVKDNKLIREYSGFESLYDLPEYSLSDMEGFMEVMNIPSEFQGTIKVTIEYVEE